MPIINEILTTTGNREKKRKKNLPDKMSIQWWKWQNKSPMTLHDHNNNDDDDDYLIWMTTMKIQKKKPTKDSNR